MQTVWFSLKWDGKGWQGSCTVARPGFTPFIFRVSPADVQEVGELVAWALLDRADGEDLKIQIETCKKTEGGKHENS